MGMVTIVYACKDAINMYRLSRMKLRKMSILRMISFLKIKLSSEEFIWEDNETEIKNDLDDVKEIINDSVVIKDLLESIKKSFIGVPYLTT